MYRFSPDESSWSIGDSIDTVTNTVNSAGSCKNVHGEDNIDEMLKHDELLFLTPRELRVKSIPNHTNVHITSIENHKTVFVRPSFTSADEYLCQLFDDIDHEGECNFHPLSYLPKCGGIYLAEFEEEFYRVFVLAATSRNHKIDVFFVDFGNTNCVWLNQLSELNDELKRRAILLNKICLANVPEITFSDNPIRFLKHLYEEEVELTLIFDEKTMQEGRKGNCRMRQNVCHLKFVDEELTVNQKLVRLNSKLCNMDLERCKDLVLTKHLPVFIYVRRSNYLYFSSAFTIMPCSCRILHIHGKTTSMWRCKSWETRKLIRWVICHAFVAINGQRLIGIWLQLTNMEKV